jgi:hypothetical protein
VKFQTREEHPQQMVQPEQRSWGAPELGYLRDREEASVARGRGQTQGF